MKNTLVVCFVFFWCVSPAIILPISPITTSLCNGRTQCVTYNGAYYSTLADATLTIVSGSCQSSYIALPSTWIIGSNNIDSRTVIAAYEWNTDVVLVSDGLAYGTRTYSNGALFSSTSYLVTDGLGNYYSRICYGEILIMQ